MSSLSFVTKNKITVQNKTKDQGAGGSYDAGHDLCLVELVERQIQESEADGGVADTDTDKPYYSLRQKLHGYQSAFRKIATTDVPAGKDINVCNLASPYRKFANRLLTQSGTST